LGNYFNNIVVFFTKKSVRIELLIIKMMKKLFFANTLYKVRYFNQKANFSNLLYSFRLYMQCAADVK